MNVKEIRDKSNDELLKTLDEFKKELFDLRFQRATGSIDNPMRIRELRKSIARILTVLKENNFCLCCISQILTSICSYVHVHIHILPKICRKF